MSDEVRAVCLSVVCVSVHFELRGLSVARSSSAADRTFSAALAEARRGRGSSPTHLERACAGHRGRWMRQQDACMPSVQGRVASGPINNDGGGRASARELQELREPAREERSGLLASTSWWQR